ncbi:ABC transporter ATP-binding protein, partial [Bordetella bronchiseptica]|nr:ABC transporter ATP-binding protein [Bordetella bronchiseptica]
LRQLIEQEKPSVVLVTHDVDEALFLADRIVVFSQRPARVLREFNLAHRARSHDLSDLASEKREILRLLGIEVDSHGHGHGPKVALAA